MRSVKRVKTVAVKARKPDNNDDSRISDGAIAGIVVGCVAVAAIFVAILAAMQHRTKKQQEQDDVELA